MVDFRSRSERDIEKRQVASEQADYKRMHDQVMAENRALHAKLDQITASHGELQARFSDLLTQFETQNADSNKRAEDLLKMAKNMEDMVATAYEKQGALMDKFRADFSQRLGDAKNSLNGFEG